MKVQAKEHFLPGQRRGDDGRLVAFNSGSSGRVHPIGGREIRVLFQVEREIVGLILQDNRTRPTRWIQGNRNGRRLWRRGKAEL